MKKIIVLLMAVCCLFVSCQKEGGSGSGSVDGTTWLADESSYRLVLRDGYASLYNYRGTDLFDTQKYKVKGGKLTFGDNMFCGYRHTYNRTYKEYFVNGSFNDAKTKLTLSRQWYDDISDIMEDYGEKVFTRVAE